MRTSSDHLQVFGALAATVAALVALFIAFDQDRMMHAQQHASVMPTPTSSVQIDDNDEAFELSTRVRNNGVGLAVVESAGLLSRGVLMQTREQLYVSRTLGGAE